MKNYASRHVRTLLSYCITLPYIPWGLKHFISHHEDVVDLLKQQMIMVVDYMWQSKLEFANRQV